eukprot:8907048-Pyramimonas_sp.AAC.1
MNDSLIQLEGYVLHWVAQQCCARAGFLLFDFKSAFPPLLRPLIFWTLEVLEIDPRIIQAIKKLYSGIRVQVVFGGVRGAFFSVLRGIKQGCPLSGTLYALTVDPILRMLGSRLPRSLGIAAAFADDLGVGTAD